MSMTMTAKEYLLRYRDAQKERMDIEGRITALRLKYAAPAALQYSDMPKANGSSHDLSDYAVELDRLTDWLVEKYCKCMGIEVDILQRLDRMEKQAEREVLRYRYIDGLDWDQIVMKTGYVLRHVYRIHGSALQNFPLPDERCH